MRPTGRVVLAAGIVAGGMAMGRLSGPRALNAIVVPVVVLVLLGVLIVVRTGKPSVERQSVDPGFVGEQRTVRSTVSVDGPAGATVADTIGPGLESLEGTRETIDRRGTLEHQVRLTTRGVHPIGPMQSRIRDVFGFFERTVTDSQHSEVVVFPPPRPMPPSVRGLLEDTLIGKASRADHEEFDHLRTHEPGESIDRVNWKATAKRPDHELMVSEYRSDVPSNELTVVGNAVPGKADELAETIAGVVTYLLDTHPDIAIGIAVPAGSIEPATGESHRMAILGLLAETGSGSIDTAGDIRVAVSQDETQVGVGDATITLGGTNGA